MDEDAVEAPAESFEDPAAFLDALISRTARRENPVCDDTAFKTDAELVDAVVDFYLKSGDFNGMPIAPTGRSHTALEAAVTQNLVQLVTDHDFPNPHIRPWPAQNIASQLEKLRMVLDPENYLSGCLYPTPSGMEGHDLSGYDGRPYSRRRAAGHGDLECVYFKMDALESYRNDPRYHFSFGDYAVDWGIGDEAYMDEDESDDDKISTVRAGFGYNAEADSKGAGPVRRYLVVLLCDLGDLTPGHQTRLSTWEVPAEGLSPHPLWWDNVMGRWAEYTGPFDKVIGELEAINEVWGIAFEEPLFRDTARPREWGWVFRASSIEWNRFIQLTDQLVSDNINVKALDRAGAPKINDQGQSLGSLNRLEAFLISRLKGDEFSNAFKVFKDIRSGRNKPSHKAVEPVTDKTVIVRQRDLLYELALSLSDIRELVASHPAVRATGWKPSEYLDKWLLL